MKSLVLSFLLTAAVCIYFMMIVDPKFSSSVRSAPNWILIGILIIIFAGYLLSLFWGVTGIVKEQRLANLCGIAFSLFGIGIYAFGFVLSNGKGKEKKGQFDHELGKIETHQQAAINNLLLQTNTKPENVQLVAYWNMTDNPADFVLCVQKGNVIAMQVKNKKIDDLSAVTALPHLSWLTMEHCNLENISKLNLPKLEHVSLANNQLTSLEGLQNSTLVYWLSFKNNPVKDSTAIKSLTNKYVYIER